MLIILICLLVLVIPTHTQTPIYSEDFLLGTNGWAIQGNTLKTNVLTYQPYSLISNNQVVANRYVCGSDGLINVDYKRKDDSNLWYFVKDFSANPIDVSKSKNKLLGFNLFGFVGNFSNLNKLSNPLVVLVGPSGLTAQTKPNLFEFKTKYLIGLNSHIFDGPIDLIIKNITQIKILGDWTRGNETIGLDNIFIL